MGSICKPHRLSNRKGVPPRVPTAFRQGHTITPGSPVAALSQHTQQLGYLVTSSSTEWKLTRFDARTAKLRFGRLGMAPGHSAHGMHTCSDMFLILFHIESTRRYKTGVSFLWVPSFWWTERKPTFWGVQIPTLKHTLVLTIPAAKVWF